LQEGREKKQLNVRLVAETNDKTF